MTRILLNFLCRPSVGHMVEAMRYTQGLYEANPGAEIHLVMSDRGVPQVTMRCPWITRTYVLHMDDFDDPDVGVAALGDLPREWDYIVDDNTIFDETDGIDPALHTPAEAALRRYYRMSMPALVATSGRGKLSPRMVLPEGLKYRPATTVQLPVPVESQAFARRYTHDGLKICVLPGSSTGHHKHPDVSSWIKIIAAMSVAFPTARIYLTGVSESRLGQTYTAAYTEVGVREILASGPDIVDCYDIGIWNQIALIESCDVIVSPNAGMACLALCVGTPLLTIAGGDDVEFFFNDVPFYVVLPDTPEFPYSVQPYLNSKIPCMRPERLDPKIPEIIEGIRLLLDPAFTYPVAVERYRENISRSVVIHRNALFVPGHPVLADF